MKERPILFSGAMVRAILDGRKTQTRRLVKVLGAEADRYPDGIVDVTAFIGSDSNPTGEYGLHSSPCVISSHVRCQYGEPGDRLWVRETWRTRGSLDGKSATQIAAMATEAGWDKPWAPIKYECDGSAVNDDPLWEGGWGRLRPSIFLPRWASRITLAVTAVRVERLQAISEADAQAEGVGRADSECDHVRYSCDDVGCLGSTFRASFADLWDSINGDRAAWGSNPWVWVVEFRRVA